MRQVFHEVVVDLCCQEGGACSGGFHLVAHADEQGIAVSQVELCAGLCASVKELGSAALAVRVVGCQTVAHLAFALHGEAAQPTVDKDVCSLNVGGNARPHLCLVDKDVIVVAEAVALGNRLVGGIQVILSLRRVLAVVLDNVGVDVVERGSPQQVVHRLVVHALVGRQLQSGIERGVFGERLLQIRCQADGQLVVVVALQVVHGIAPLLRHHAVGIVQAVPVDLSVLLRCAQIVVGRLPVAHGHFVAVAVERLVDVEERAGHVGVVVGCRV